MVGGSPQLAIGRGARRATELQNFLYIPLRREQMRLSSPRQITWIIALILGVVGILANLASIPVITPALGFWLVVVAWALLLIASVASGL